MFLNSVPEVALFEGSDCGGELLDPFETERWTDP